MTAGSTNQEAQRGRDLAALIPYPAAPPPFPKQASGVGFPDGHRSIYVGLRNVLSHGLGAIWPLLCEARYKLGGLQLTNGRCHRREQCRGTRRTGHSPRKVMGIRLE